MNKINELKKYSDPYIAQMKAFKYLGPSGILYISNRKDKKYMVFDPNNNKFIHFGAFPNYEDYTKHKDSVRRNAYLKRSKNIKGGWKTNKYSPNNLSIHILW